MHIDSVFKVVLTVLLSIAVVLSGTSLVAANVDVVVANNYFDDVATVISESNYSESVIQDCIDDATENGYTLTVNVIGSTEPGMKRYAELTFEYYYQIALFGVKDLKTKTKIV